jgi:signal transduction histidine kinase
MKRAIAIALASFLAGAAAVTVPHRMGWGQIGLVALAIAGGALAAWLATRLIAEERSRGQIERARRQLVASVSHDLRTPLASLRLLVESIDDGVATGETRDRYLGEMRTHVEVLTALIDDLFELSRIEAGEISWTMRQVELRELIDDTVAAMQAPAEARGVALAAELPPHEVLASANAEKLQRVLFNLIQNAIRHTPADGSVTVRARSAAGGVEVEVADDGEGISPEDGNRVFDAFYRGEESRRGDGAGLGLAISRAIVEAHGGRIWLEGAAPGTRVRFTLRAVQ